MSQASCKAFEFAALAHCAPPASGFLEALRNRRSRKSKEHLEQKSQSNMYLESCQTTVAFKINPLVQMLGWGRVGMIGFSGSLG